MLTDMLHCRENSCACRLQSNDVQDYWAVSNIKYSYNPIRREVSWKLCQSLNHVEVAMWDESNSWAVFFLQLHTCLTNLCDVANHTVLVRLEIMSKR